jgi:glycosyltransferase involved in cell wall biosynthesis
VGGAEVLVRLLCRMQRDHGHTPDVHCLYRLGPLADVLKEDGIPVHFHRGGSRIDLMRRLHHSFSSRRTEVVHCHNAMATILAAPSARAAGAQAIVSTRHGLVAPPYNRKREVQFSLASRLCDAVVGVCEATSRNLRQAPLARRSRIVTVYNGAQPALPSNPALFERDPQKFTLLQVGRLAEPKDPATLLRAVNSVRREISALRLWLVGDGALGGSLRQLSAELGLEECVTFFGEQKTVGDFLQAADLFVLSSKSEGLPVSLLEAMAAGLPMLITDVGGMPEVALPSGAAIAVPPQEPDKLAEAIRQFWRRRDEWPRLSTAARAHYQSRFTLAQMDQNYKDLYERFLARRPT